MFLLIRKKCLKCRQGLIFFTFHNVSINTEHPLNRRMFPYHFTFHNVSINTLAFRLPWLFTLSFTFHNVSINTNDNLNKTPADKVFTFHNVSINTRRLEFRLIRLNTLHSTMFLLILRNPRVSRGHMYTLHSTMFLLIQDS